MTLIKDLIYIPERVQKGDFVLRLTEGVTRAEETLRDYVVTPELEECFNSALIFIRSAPYKPIAAKPLIYMAALAVAKVTSWQSCI